ncbi:uncharacterized protein LOC108904432 [Anoplophora glabripennis]|uniref:uncharacterized protein LOC108904432 n=1 Tax=Anoplophora glabripennis TaxID=217634 RepID=UPI0008745AB6|nr:uncharacterized protein LOC108904432 [Anoplophora glabripennis]
MEFYNGNSYILRTEVIVPPTYLKELFVDEDSIILAYDKRDVPDENGVSSPVDNIKQEIANNTTSDLTGDPLKVDLDGDESFGSYVHSEKPNHWSAEESHHFPLSLKIAREFLNRQNCLKKCEEENQKPIYVVCDGKNVLHTVLIGSQKCNKFIMTTLVNVVGCYSKDHEVTSLEAMEIDHVKNTRIKNPKVDYLVKFKYFLYGSVLQTFKNVNQSEYHGNVSVEVTCNRCVFNVPQSPSNMKMILQIIAGHNLSSVYFLWEELTLLQTYLDILSDSDKCNDEITIISNNPLQESDIYKSINNIIATNLLKREAKMKFDLKHIRQEQILDKLWSILKESENLSVLRDSLHYFFEELVEAETNIKIPENDKSNIATLINGILNGKLAVPTLTFSQALECLFELGAEKLKNDYQAILKNFYSSSEQAIFLKWSKFKSGELTSQSGYRKTRITVNLKSGVMDLNQYVSKLAYLGKLHIATELTFLIKDQANLPEETFDYFCERVYKNYVDKDTAPHNFIDLQTRPLCEFSIVLNSADTNIIKSETPAAWAMQMTSKVGSVEITTTYHLSEYPIFPTVIYDDYDPGNITDEHKMVYYVSKLLSHKEFL